jgi:hypothetical protein
MHLNISVSQLIRSTGGDKVVQPWDLFDIDGPVNESQKTTIIIIIIIIISGSTVLVRTLAASHRRFRNLIKTHGTPHLDK